MSCKSSLGAFPADQSHDSPVADPVRLAGQGPCDSEFDMIALKYGHEAAERCKAEHRAAFERPGASVSADEGVESELPVSHDGDERLQSKPLEELTLHIELRELGREIEARCDALGIRCEDLCPVISDVLPMLPDGTIFGNWPAYRQARLQKTATVRVHRYLRLDWDEPEIALRALTSVSRKGYEDPLLLGLIYRRWRGFEDCTIARRQSRSVDRWFRDLHGMSEREYYHRELTRRLGRSIRDLQRLASVLDVPPEWQRLYRHGVVPLTVLERYLTLSPADQDDLMDDLRGGAPVAELVRDYGLKPDRKERRLQHALAGAVSRMRECACLLEAQLRQKS